MWRRACVTLMSLGVLAGGWSCGPQSGGGPVVILAASSLAVPLDSLVAELQTTSGIEITVAYGGSGTLAQQIRSGAAAALYLSADVDWIERLLVEDSLVTAWWPWLSNRLVVITADAQIAALGSLNDLRGESIESIAVADPDAAPAGRYAIDALTAAGLHHSVGGKLVPTDNVSACAAAVRTGAADVGFVYATDALQRPDLRVLYSVPDSLVPEIRYGLAVIGQALNTQPQVARVIEYLRSDDALSAFRAAGFLPPPAVDEMGQR